MGRTYTNDMEREENGANGCIPARIANEGMGGFLNPPGHPEHTRSVETYQSRRRYQHNEPDGYMSLSTALESDFISNGMQRAISRLFERWEETKPALDTPECREWIRQVMRHFSACYRGDGAGEEVWCAPNIRGRSDWDPMAHAYEHCGVHWIRRFYPEYIPAWQDFGDGPFTVYEGLDGEPLWTWRLDMMAWIRTEQVGVLWESYQSIGPTRSAPQWFPGVLIEDVETKGAK